MHIANLKGHSSQMLHYYLDLFSIITGHIIADSQQEWDTGDVSVLFIQLPKALTTTSTVKQIGGSMQFAVIHCLHCVDKLYGQKHSDGAYQPGLFIITFILHCTVKCRQTDTKTAKSWNNRKQHSDNVEVIHGQIRTPKAK